MAVTESLTSLNFLIIGGTSKAGTTSVFNYFAGHPDICPAEKETRFFLDSDYPLPSGKRYKEDGIEAYLSLFGDAPAKCWRFEATPDYLHSEDTAKVINQALPNVRFVFILREPISRLISWYRFGCKRTEIGLDMTFDEYITLQADSASGDPSRALHPAYRALEQGRYSNYLKPYFDLFGKSRIYVGFYEQLRSDPVGFVTAICRWIEVDPDYFRDFQFSIANKGSDVRSRYLHKGYVQGKQFARKLVRQAPAVRSILRRVRGKVDTAYDKINLVKNRPVTMSASVRDFLNSYYADEAAQLKQMFGLEAPWPPHQPIARRESVSQEAAR